MDIIELFLFDLDKLSLEYILRMQQVFASGVSDVELAILISETNFFQEFLGAEFDGRINKFLDEYDDEIAKLILQAQDKGLAGINKVNLSSLEALKELDLAKILRRAEDFDGEVRSELLRQIITGKSSKQITDSILPNIQSEMKFAPNWFASALNTSYQNYNATATETLFEDEPDAKFYFDEPNDARVRPACKYALELFKTKYKDGLTVKEINAGAIPYINAKGVIDPTLKYDFVNRGGFNCRHQWKLKL
ncbi:MAG: hypothetical protein IPJ03_17555 [Ignavibacteriales bacterium]|nr:hypothetical protein [Ignavibacteriales bacterium]